MTYLYIFIILCSGYYTLTYGISLWRDDKNKLGGFAAMALALIGALAPIVILVMKSAGG